MPVWYVAMTSYWCFLLCLRSSLERVKILPWKRSLVNDLTSLIPWTEFSTVAFTSATWERTSRNTLFCLRPKVTPQMMSTGIGMIEISAIGTL